jgi:hypothetical protein
MATEPLLQAIAPSLAGLVHNQDDGTYIAQAALDAIEAAGFFVVHRDTLQRLVDGSELPGTELRP